MGFCSKSGGNCVSSTRSVWTTEKGVEAEQPCWGLGQGSPLDLWGQLEKADSQAKVLRPRGPGPARWPPPALAGCGVLGEAHCTLNSSLPSPPTPTLAWPQAVGVRKLRGSRCRLRQLSLPEKTQNSPNSSLLRRRALSTHLITWLGALLA